MPRRAHIDDLLKLPNRTRRAKRRHQFTHKRTIAHASFVDRLLSGRASPASALIFEGGIARQAVHPRPGGGLAENLDGVLAPNDWAPWRRF